MKLLKILISVMVALFFTGCTGAMINKTIGPCYGSGYPMPGFMSCYYDVDHDSKPDIVLIYKWNGEILVLVDTMMITEYNQTF